jgi:phosphopantothenoylcysteine synthetase/decarboxylase
VAPATATSSVFANGIADDLTSLHLATPAPVLAPAMNVNVFKARR